MSARVIQVIDTFERRGTGTPDDPVRMIHQLYAFDGTLLHEAEDRDDGALRPGNLCPDHHEPLMLRCSRCGTLDRVSAIIRIREFLDSNGLAIADRRTGHHITGNMLEGPLLGLLMVAEGAVPGTPRV